MNDRVRRTISRTPNTQVFGYILSVPCCAGQTTVEAVIPVAAFKARKFRTSVKSEGLVTIDGLLFKNEQLITIGSFDAYIFSNELVHKMHDQFYLEHGLAGKSLDEVQTYLDDNELVLPDPTNVFVPTMTKGEVIKITGKFTVDCVLTFIGTAINNVIA